MTSSVLRPQWVRTRRTLVLLAVAIALVAAAAAAVTLLLTRSSAPAVTPAGSVHYSVVDDGCAAASPGHPC